MPSVRISFYLLSLFVVCLGICLVWAISPPRLHSQTYTDLHDFNCAVEGCDPEYPAILAQGRDGNLYGTTNSGGTSGMGTVFKMTPSGTYTTIYNFSGADGQNPLGGVVLGTDGNFYGTTRFGGANNLGTVFKITPAGVLTTLHSFARTDGSEPRPGLVQGKNGVFYGTTCGFNPPWTSYSITAAGKFKTINSTNDLRIALCSFAPFMLADDGNLYGTTAAGGQTEQGTVFRMSQTGAVKGIFAGDFTNGTNFVGPVTQGNDGFLYGTASANGSGGFGVVFKLSLKGKYTKLHEFGLDLANDGFDPLAGLVAASDGKFYGATSAGENGSNVPQGNLFSITSSGTYNIVFAFDGPHGRLEQATPMQHTNGKIYGTTVGGGLHEGGVVYSLDNSAPPFLGLTTRWGSSGQTAQILGQGLAGATSVKFGTGSASFNIVSDTFATATVPDDGTTGFVTVTTPSGTLTSARSFFVVPAVVSIAPTSGPVGTQVTITGSGFLGATVVKFGGVKATSFTVNSGTSITATVPVGAKTGKVTITTKGGNASSRSTFTVTP